MINKLILIGNLGADPEIKFTQNGAPVATFTVVQLNLSEDAWVLVWVELA